MATLLLLRALPRLRPAAHRAAPLRRYAAALSSAPDASQSPETSAVSTIDTAAGASSSTRATVASSPLRPPPPPPPRPPPPPPPPSNTWAEDPDYRRWKNKEKEIFEDIDPIIFRTKDILHSDRYEDGERLTDEDEKEVTEKLLAYHPHSEDKIGCGVACIMVDRHPQFRRSRCLFVVRADGVWIDFSYQKCLRAYIRDKYPSHAERFIREHFKRG